MTIEEFKKIEIERMLKEGKTQEEIGKSLGITKQAVSQWLKVNGYTLKHYWERT